MAIILSTQAWSSRAIHPKMSQIMQPTGQLQCGTCARFFCQTTTLPCVFQLRDRLTNIKSINALRVEVQNRPLNFMHECMLHNQHEIFVTVK